MIDSFKVDSLCVSVLASEYTLRKNRLFQGTFAKSSELESFSNPSVRSILSNLKHLRLCELSIDPTVFAQTINSFGQLEELALFYIKSQNKTKFKTECKTEIHLNLPMLKEIWLQYLDGFAKLTLDTPRLRKVTLKHCFSSLPEFIHAESIEKVITSDMDDGVRGIDYETAKTLTNLKFFYCGILRELDPTLLSDLKQLKEIHLGDRNQIQKLFEQIQRYRRTDLKIYLCGRLLSGPKDPARFNCFNSETSLGDLAANHSSLADAIPFYDHLDYSSIERVPSALAIDIVNRFTGLYHISVYRRVQDIECFLSFLKSFDNITVLDFSGNRQQALFDQLPGHFAVQNLTIRNEISNFDFLCKFKNLISLRVYWPIDIASIQKILKELKFLLQFKCRYLGNDVKIERYHSRPKEFSVTSDKKGASDLPELDAVIQSLKD